MIQIYGNWYQLNSNELWDKPDRGHYDGRTFLLFCLAVQKARLLPDRNTVVMVTASTGYKLRLSDHDKAAQNDIIDAITPLIVEL